MDELELAWWLTAAPVVAVTGTNGKSTTAALLVAVLSAAGRRPLLAGNTTFGSPLSAVDPDRAAGGCIVAEVSSFQAEASPRFMPEAAVFTNLTREHIHRHGSVAACGRAKRRLFVRGARVVPLAAVNSDDRFGRRLLAEVGELGGTAVGFGTSPAADYRVRSAATLGLDAATLELDTPSGAVTLRTRLPGEYNAMNVAGTLALADGLGVERDASLAALESAAPVPRRFERIDAGQSFEVIVDFAHNPDGVQRALALARELASKRGGRVIAVLGVVGRGDWHTREHRRRRGAAGTRRARAVRVERPRRATPGHARRDAGGRPSGRRGRGRARARTA